MTDLEHAMRLLSEDPALTCVLCCGDALYTSTARGISPMLDFADAGVSLSGFSAADRIVGKAAAMLFVLSNVKDIYAEVTTPAAVELLRAYGIRVSWRTLTDHIVNRDGTGLCPMEEAVRDLSEPKSGEVAIRRTRERLSKK